MHRSLVWLLVFMLLGTAGAYRASLARDAAFATPGTMAKGSAAVSDAVAVEPKGEINTGDSIVNVARRTTLFFANKTNSPVEVVSINTNDDGNVKSSIVSDDCSREHNIAPGSRCSVIVETTPSNIGGWTAEVLLTHNGIGRIARAKLIGKAAGQATDEKKDSGFALSTKEVKPIDFGDVEAKTTKIVRTALMVNDSPENITLLSIDVIAAENGLERLDQGCVVDMELKPGESCPVTLVWQPESKGVISTDLIIRHSGRLGFAVIPIRGAAKGDDNGEAAAETTEAASRKEDNGRSAVKSNGRQPTTAEVLEKAAADKIPPLTSSFLPMKGAGMSSHSDLGTSTATAAKAAAPSGEFHLIGTVGNRAVLLLPDGMTSVVSVGDEVSFGESMKAKLTSVMPKEAEIFYEGKKKKLVLEAAAALTSKAAAAAASAQGEKDKQAKPKTSGSSSSGVMEK
ncbi:MAG: hypothetical protein PHY92_03640 [Alphaproteobacteria bacterium]|nr:hypothetical protein [Alphaproteobacteria bacterium]